MTIEEIKADREKLINELRAINQKYQGILEYLAMKEKELEKPKEGD
jgi:hypothetical protein